MEIEIVDITSLGERQLAALEVLMAEAFAGEPTELVHVEIQRASDPRLGRGLVATQDGQVVGAVLSRQPRAGSVFVVYVAVASPMRRRGLAPWLLDELAGAGGERMELFVSEGNAAAARLYRAGGLVPVAGPAPQGQRRWAGVWKPHQDRPVAMVTGLATLEPVGSGRRRFLQQLTAFVRAPVRHTDCTC